MQYLLLVYLNEKQWARVPPATKEQLWKDCDAYGRDLIQRGHFLGGAPLREPATARTLRRRRQKWLVTDGPFAETKEVLAGFHWVECADGDEALRLSEGFPGLKLGMSIEVRPVLTERMIAKAAPKKTKRKQR